MKKEKKIPSWVNDITLKDGHKNMEIHDEKWLQWCLDYKFTNEPQDKQEFYSVYDKNGESKGFFMTKTRFSI